MPYVLHFYRMTYKTYDMQEYIFVHPEEWHSRKTHSSGFFSFSSFSIKKMSRSLEALRLQPLGRTTAVFSRVLDLLLPKHGVHKDTARYVLSYSKPFELLSKINVDFLPKSENQATCVSFLSLNIHKSVIFCPSPQKYTFVSKSF